MSLENALHSIRIAEQNYKSNRCKTQALHLNYAEMKRYLLSNPEQQEIDKRSLNKSKQECQKTEKR